MTDTETEYSLWLTLAEETEPSREFRDVISGLAATHEDAVVFESYITVISGIDRDHRY